MTHVTASVILIKQLNSNEYKIYSTRVRTAVRRLRRTLCQHCSASILRDEQSAQPILQSHAT